ncbi:hypothetical protein D3C81_1948360 [compost metagenome]
MNTMQRLMRGCLVKIGPFLAKRCSCCGVTKEIEKFQDDNSKASGVRSWCAVCMRKADTARRRKPRT